jgi:predicted permease
VRIWETTPSGEPFSAADANYLDFRERNRSFAEMAAVREIADALTLTGDGEPRQLQSVAATATLFPLLGVRPALGRTFSADEDRPGDNRVVVLGHALWAGHFGGDPSLVGRTLTLNGEPYRVAGVMPAGFDFPGGAEAWLPAAVDRERERDDHELAVFARLRPGVTVEQADADLRRVAALLGRQHPTTNEGWGARLVTFSDWIVGDRFRQTLLVLLGAVGFLLLIACFNVANLLVARATTRHAEIGIRAALGAGRSRLVRQLLTESALLALIGSAGGLVVAAAAVAGLRAAAPDGIPRVHEVSVDARVLGFALAAGLVSSVLFGLAPAVHASRIRVHDLLKLGGRSAPGRGRWRSRDLLVVGEVALAMTLLVGAGLMITSFARLGSADAGFAEDGVRAVPLQLPDGRYTDERRSAFVREVLTRIEGVPGVIAAGATSTNPFRQFGFSNDVTPADRAAEAPPGGFMQAGWRSVTPGFFRAMGIPLLRGRPLLDSDRAGAARVVVISGTMAHRMWPGEDPIGKGLFWGGITGTPRTVVGVVGDVEDVALEADPPPVMFLPYDQVEVPAVTLVIKAAPGARGVASAIRREIWAADAGLAVPEVQLLAQNRARAVAGPRFTTLVVSAFASVALALAAMGIYGLTAFGVAQRTREIGVRIALGARPARVAGAVLRRGVLLALGGVALGLAGSIALTRVLVSLLYETTPTDPTTYATVALLLGGVAALASYVPARRAARVDPMVALRAE